MKSTASLVAIAILATSCSTLLAQEKPKTPTAAAKPKKWEDMDYGRFLSASFINSAGKNILDGQGSATNKGIAVNLGNKEGAQIFDTELLRFSGGWTGGWVKLKGVAFDGGHGPNPGPTDGANIYYQVNPGPGWSKGDDFADPRKVPTGPGAAVVPLGTLPKDWARYGGLFISGDTVVFRYTVGDAQILETAGLEKVGDSTVLTRTFQIEKAGAGSSVKVADPQNGGTLTLADGLATLAKEDPKAADAVTVVGVVDAPAGAALVQAGTSLALKLPKLEAGARFKLVYARGTDAAALATAVKGAAKPVDLTQYTKGGPARWTEKVVTQGKTAEQAATEDEGKLQEKLTKAEADQEKAKAEAAAATDAPTKADLENTVAEAGDKVAKAQEALKAAKLEHSNEAYVLDTIGTPLDNPYKSWLRIGGLDFFPDGRAVVSTWSGDVWLVSGLDKDLQKVTWQRIGTGLFHALGVKIVKDQIYVLGRDQITILNDLNGDGETDFYQNFNNDVQITPNFHEFAFDLQTDPSGNFYFTKGGPVNPGGRGWGPLSNHHGCIFKISPDGQTFEVFATGIRAPNGMGVGPKGEVTVGDNQGTWVPACYLHLATKNDFVSVTDLAHRDTPPTEHGKHLLYFPMSVDNSSGGQTWVTSDKWGPLKGNLLHLTYGKSGLLGVVVDEVNGTKQAAAYRFPFKFDSGAMRGRFNPQDGQLYVVGLKGWQTDGALDGCFQRVRYTGKTVTQPEKVRITDKGVHLSFTAALDANTAADAGNYSFQQWNYKWTSAYGSPDFKVSDPEVKGRDTVEIKSASLSADGKSVFLAIDGLKPVDQYSLKLNVKTANGLAAAKEIVGTIHAVAAETK